MKASRLFDSVVNSFEQPFTKSDIWDVLQRNSEWNKEKWYLGNLLRDRTKRGYLEKNRDLYTRVSLIDIGTRLTDSEDESSTHKPRINFSKKTISEEEAIKFFIFTIKKMYELGDKLHLTETQIDSYFKSTDKTYLNPSNALNQIQFVFKELAYHAQNGSGIANIVKFEPGSDIDRHISDITNGYDASQVLKTEADFLAHGSYARYNPDQIKVLKRYYRCLFDIRVFLSRYSTPAMVHNELISAGLIPSQLVNKMVSHFSCCYKKALTFDFLKEFGRAHGFNNLDFPKPDLHVRRTMVLLFNGHPDMNGYLNNVKSFSDYSIDEYETIGLHKEIIDLAERYYISHGGTQLGKIKNYLLDKAIYVVCSGKFYVHRLNGGRKFGIQYSQSVVNGNYKNEPVDMVYLNNFLSRL